MPASPYHLLSIYKLTNASQINPTQIKILQTSNKHNDYRILINRSFSSRSVLSSHQTISNHIWFNEPRTITLVHPMTIELTSKLKHGQRETTISHRRVILAKGNIRRYPIAPFPLFICALSAFIT